MEEYDPAYFQALDTELAEALERQSQVSDMAGPSYEGIARRSAKAINALFSAERPRT